jgi:hypothetical protein
LANWALARTGRKAAAAAAAMIFFFTSDPLAERFLD